MSEWCEWRPVWGVLPTYLPVSSRRLLCCISIDFEPSESWWSPHDLTPVAGRSAEVSIRKCRPTTGCHVLLRHVVCERRDESAPVHFRQRWNGAELQTLGSACNHTHTCRAAHTQRQISWLCFATLSTPAHSDTESGLPGQHKLLCHDIRSTIMIITRKL